MYKERLKQYPGSVLPALLIGVPADIGAIFQAPRAGTLFVVEVLLFDAEVTSLSRIVIAAVSGTMTARHFLPDARAFILPPFHLYDPNELLLYAGLGIIAGLEGLALMGGHIFTAPVENSRFPHFIVLDKQERLAGVLTLRDFRRIFAHPEQCTRKLLRNRR